MDDPRLYSLLATLIHASTVFVVIGVAGELVFGVWQGKVHDRLEASTKAELAAKDERALKAERDLKLLQDANRPRTLSSEQRQKLVVLLRPFAGQRVLVDNPQGDGEAHTYAQQLADALREAGLVIVDMTQGMGYDVEPYSVSLNFHVAQIQHNAANGMMAVPTEQVPPALLTMVEAFKEADVAVEPGVLAGAAQDSLVLRIGHKPPPH